MKHTGGKDQMNETTQAIVEVKREVQLAEWQRQIQERQEQGMTVDEWCASVGIGKGAYYHRLRKVREYMCKNMGLVESGEKKKEASQPTAVVPIRTPQPKEKAAIEMQLGELQIRFNENPDAEQLKVILASLMSANNPVC